MNIYISNLNFATKDESLRNLFAGYGDVSSANVITDRETGRSRGFGFVEMPDETQGRSAIDALNETEFEAGKSRFGFFIFPYRLFFANEGNVAFA